MTWRGLAAKAALASLVLSFASLPKGMRLGHGMTPEFLALVATGELAKAEWRFRDVEGRYGRMDELLGRRNRDLSRRLQAVRRIGYAVRLEASNDRFVIRAIPEEERRGKPGWRRTFYADESRVIRESWTGSMADANSPPAR